MPRKPDTSPERMDDIHCHHNDRRIEADRIGGRPLGESWYAVEDLFARIEALEAGLRPFALWFEAIDARSYRPHLKVAAHRFGPVTMADLEHAHTLLAKEREG